MNNNHATSAFKDLSVTDLVPQVIEAYKKNGGIRKTSRLLNINPQKVKKILLANGVIEDECYSQIKALHDEGLSTKEIADRLDRSLSYVNAHLPYEKCIYKAERPTLNAVRIKKHRARQRGEPMPERKGQHLSWDNRLTIWRMLSNGESKKSIANAIGTCLATVYNEIKRGKDESGEYNPRIADDSYREKLREKGREAKLSLDKEQLAWFENKMLNEKYSPATALMEINTKSIKFAYPIKSVNTIYKAIRDGRFEQLELRDLPEGGRRQKKRRKRVRKKKLVQNRKSIEERSEDVNSRDEFGHWELDTVVGKRSNKKNLLVFTERKTRNEIIEELMYHTADEVRKALNRVERRFGSTFYSVFKTITVDNGAEFQDCLAMQKALCRIGQRTEIYYCHPNCPQERGSNENQNKLIRRFYGKGTDFDKIVTRSGVKEIENWMNNYPRKILGGLTPGECFKRELKAIGVT